MKTHLLRFWVILMTISTMAITAQNDIHSDVKMEIEAVAQKEQKAFKEGDCETVGSLMAEDITFFANGRRVPSKEMVVGFCSKIPRPFQTLDSDRMEIYVLNKESGYVVRTLEFKKNESITVKEIVTKIWNKEDGQWKIKHLQSTVLELPMTKQ